MFSFFFQALLAEETISTYLEQREKGLSQGEIARNVFNVSLSRLYSMLGTR